jgi:hypothetical protein
LDEVTGGWRKLHDEELRDLYSSPSIIRMIKSRRMRWAGHIARMGRKEHVLVVGNNNTNLDRMYDTFDYNRLAKIHHAYEAEHIVCKTPFRVSYLEYAVDRSCDDDVNVSSSQSDDDVPYKAFHEISVVTLR